MRNCKSMSCWPNKPTSFVLFFNITSEENMQHKCSTWQLSVIPGTVVGAGKGKYYNPCNREEKQNRGHIASKEMDWDMKPGLPHTHLLQTFYSTKNALVVDPEDLVSSEFIIKLPKYVSFDYRSSLFCSRICRHGKFMCTGSSLQCPQSRLY